jgi:hypothetical protein
VRVPHCLTDTERAGDVVLPVCATPPNQEVVSRSAPFAVGRPRGMQIVAMQADLDAAARGGQFETVRARLDGLGMETLDD